jgi:hypothetical protein
MNTERYPNISHPNPPAARFGVRAWSGVFRHLRDQATTYLSIMRQLGDDRTVHANLKH